MKIRKRPGQTLIEVTMAALIAAITTTAVFSVVLSSFVADSRADKRDAAAMALRQAAETLKSYVSAVPSDADMFPGVVPALPGAPGTPPGHWIAETDKPNALALAAGKHNISSLVQFPPLTEDGGVAAEFTYFVTNSDCLGADIVPAATLTDAKQCKEVEFTLKYAD